MSKAEPSQVNGDPRLWFKPYCRECKLLFDSYGDFIEHCRKVHWKMLD